MFDPASETEKDWHLELQEDVKEEVAKQGKVDFIFVDVESPGYVYLLFETVESSQRVSQIMHGRKFSVLLLLSRLLLLPFGSSRCCLLALCPSLLLPFLSSHSSLCFSVLPNRLV